MKLLKRLLGHLGFIYCTDCGGKLEEYESVGYEERRVAEYYACSDSCGAVG
jgi:hypothetical protein